MEYTIKDFCKLVGLPPSKLRFYEKKGLITARRDENGYRVYTEFDAFMLNGFRIRRLVGFPVGEATEINGSTDPDALDRRLSQTLAELEAERRRVEHRLSYLRDAKALLGCYLEDPYRVEPVPPLSGWFLPVTDGLRFSPFPGGAEVIERWGEDLAVGRPAMLFSADGFAGEAVLPDHYGNFALEGEIEAWDLPRSGVLRPVRLARPIACFSATPADCLYGLDRLPHLQDYLRENRLRLTGQVLTFPFFFALDDDPEHDDLEYVLADTTAL